MNPFLQMLALDAVPSPIGTWLMSASPLLAEAMGHAGFDWGLVDMEHSPLDLKDVVHLLQACAGTPMQPVVRVPWNDAVAIKRVLDAGARTLMVPFVQDADEARAAVAATRYAPAGVRGLAAMSRASRFGTTPNYLATANDGMAVIVQLETREAIARVGEIAAVPGVDALFVGPGDLSATMGLIGQTQHPAVMDEVAKAVAGAKAVGKPIGTVGGTPEVVARYRDMGFDYVAIGSDLSLLMRSAQDALRTLRARAPVDGDVASVY